jgi:4a-hydroxytetrahydrobiopterin dehydratase
VSGSIRENTDPAILEQAQTLQHWDVNDDGKLELGIEFDDFKQAFSFMTQVALRAEQINHHPEWYNVYNRVSMVLYTHDSENLTEKDIQLAAFVDEALEG